MLGEGKLCILPDQTQWLALCFLQWCWDCSSECSSQQQNTIVQAQQRKSLVDRWKWAAVAEVYGEGRNTWAGFGAVKGVLLEHPLKENLVHCQWVRRDEPSNQKRAFPRYFWHCVWLGYVENILSHWSEAWATPLLETVLCLGISPDELQRSLIKVSIRAIFTWVIILFKEVQI